MYREVRFQRNTSLSLKKEAAVFRLKRSSKYLPTAEYATNLAKYLDQSRNVTNLTMNDLRNVLTGLNGAIANQNQEPRVSEVKQTESISTDQSKESSESSETEQLAYQNGEHLACVWFDDVES